MKNVCLLVLMYLLIGGCTKSEIFNQSIDSNSIESVNMKSTYDGYFDWDRIDNITTKDQYNRDVIIDLPWEKGASNNIGIPSSWLDANSAAPVYSNRFYARENGWELVYSNMHKNTTTKYFALYHRYLGLLKFFFYEISTAAGQGSSQVFWGIKVDNQTSLLNFMGDISYSADKRVNQPSYISSTQGTLFSNQFVSTGYKANNWYGLEIECAYDPLLSSNTPLNFEVKGWACQVIKMTGTAISQGSITGSIELFPKAMGFNMSLSNMFNTNNSTTINYNKDGLVDNLGDQIQTGVSSNDSFLKSLWNNIKNKANEGLGAGVKDGLMSLISTNGVKALGGLVNSILGFGNHGYTGKVDLRTKINTEIRVEGETNMVGWGSISSLPVSGTGYSSSLYNDQLGVWNLQSSAKIELDIEREVYPLVDMETSSYSYYLHPVELVLNPSISSSFSVRELRAEIVYYSNEINSDIVFIDENACGYINGVRHYALGQVAYTGCLDFGGSFRHGLSLANNDFKVLVSFELVSKNDSNIVYSFSRYFAPECVEGHIYVTEVE